MRNSFTVRPAHCKNFARRPRRSLFQKPHECPAAKYINLNARKFSFRCSKNNCLFHYCVTVKSVLLAVEPPLVLITILPVTAPVGTLAVT